MQTIKPMPRTEGQIETLICRDDQAAVNALLALIRCGIDLSPGDDLLLDFCAQILMRKDRKAAGTLSADCPLLSPRQLELWRRKAFKYTPALLQIAGGKPTAPTAPTSESAEENSIRGILDLFARASEHLQFPKVRLEVGGQRVVIALAGQKSKHPGALQITDGGPFGANVWFGRITQDGAFARGRDCTDDVRGLVEEFSLRPAEMAAEYGRLTGNCCFCGRHLGDERSTSTGYGPICAEKWGLPWGGAKREEAAPEGATAAGGEKCPKCDGEGGWWIEGRNQDEPDWEDCDACDGSGERE